MSNWQLYCSDSSNCLLENII